DLCVTPVRENRNSSSWARNRNRKAASRAMTSTSLVERKPGASVSVSRHGENSARISGSESSVSARNSFNDINVTSTGDRRTLPSRADESPQKTSSALTAPNTDRRGRWTRRWREARFQLGFHICRHAPEAHDRRRKDFIRGVIGQGENR